MQLKLKTSSLVKLENNVSLDGDLIVCLKVLELVVLVLFLLVYDFGLVGQPVSQLGLFRPRLSFLEHLVEVRLFLGIFIVHRQVHRGLFGTRLRNVGLLKYVGEGLIGGQLSDFGPIGAVILKFPRSSFEYNLAAGKVLIDRSAEFLHFFRLFVALVKQND